MRTREVSVCRGESGISFSPDSRWVAFTAPDDLDKYSMTNGRVYLRATSDRGKPFRKMGGSFDGDVSAGFWSKDGNTIYFARFAGSGDKRVGWLQAGFRLDQFPVLLCWDQPFADLTRYLPISPGLL